MLDPADHLGMAADRAALAAILDAQGRHHAALVRLGEAVAIVEAELGGEHYEMAHLLIVVAGVAERAGKRRQAEACYERALSLQRRILGEDHAGVRETRRRLALLREHR